MIPRLLRILFLPTRESNTCAFDTKIIVIVNQATDYRILLIQLLS